MTPEEAATELSGCEYRNEVPRDMRERLKAAGLVAVYGASDDLMEFEGAVNNEVGAPGRIRFTKQGLLENRCAEGDECPYFQKIEAGFPAFIEALWCKDEDYSWTYRTNIPHASFEVMEGEEKYCRGIVFRLEDVPGE